MPTFEQFLAGVPMEIDIGESEKYSVKYVSCRPHVGHFEITDKLTGKLKINSIIAEIGHVMSLGYTESIYLAEFYAEYTTNRRGVQGAQP